MDTEVARRRVDFRFLLFFPSNCCRPLSNVFSLLAGRSGAGRLFFESGLDPVLAGLVKIRGIGYGSWVFFSFSRERE